MLLALSWMVSAGWLWATWSLFSGLRRIESLDEVLPAADAGCPSLSVIVPACNEAATIEPALRSLLALDYPSLGLIVVDDRSTDETGRIVERLAVEDARLRVVHVTELPAGWLGKNHALHVGSQAAAGDWLLFTDADVVYRPGALRRVMAWAARTGSDHVVAMPRIIMRGFWERLFVPYFMVIFDYRFQPWKVADPRSSAYMGVGAFNLVRAGVYRQIGGHAALPLEVADDMKLGKLLKAHGARSAVVHAFDWISVRWVIGLRGIVEGLTKNMFAGVEFRLGMVVATIVALLAAHVYPIFGLFAGGAMTVACGLTLACMAGAAAVVTPPEAGDGSGDTAARTGLPPVLSRFTKTVRQGAWGLAFPLAALVFLYIMVRSTWLTYRRGVFWRGTLYKLEELRRGVV